MQSPPTTVPIHRMIRLSVGVTQGQVADAYGCHALSIGRWEKQDPTELPYRLLGVYARLCGCTVNQVAGLEPFTLPVSQLGGGNAQVAQA